MFVLLESLYAMTIRLGLACMGIFYPWGKPLYALQLFVLQLLAVRTVTVRTMQSGACPHIWTTMLLLSEDNLMGGHVVLESTARVA